MSIEYTLYIRYEFVENQINFAAFVRSHYTHSASSRLFLCAQLAAQNLTKALLVKNRSALRFYNLKAEK